MILDGKIVLNDVTDLNDLWTQCEEIVSLGLHWVMSHIQCWIPFEGRVADIEALIAPCRLSRYMISVVQEPTKI